MEAIGIEAAAVAEHLGPERRANDHQLVNAVRRGDDRAFEALYSRYQRRIAAYVQGMVSDHARAEDITQEVFVSALRRIQQTERPIAFKPWIYEIAKNACIDAYRRGRRTEEVSYDAEDRLSASDQRRLVAAGPQPDAAVAAKQELDALRGAMGGLSDSHHEILVLREFEGRSYSDIGERMGMSRPAVESTLFRARKRLGEEYDELSSGAICVRVEAIIAGSEGQRLGARDRRKLTRHVSHCRPCRRLAARAGLELPVPVRRRAADRIPAWLPLPGFLRLRRGGVDQAPAASGGTGHWIGHVPVLADSMSSGWSKAVAGLAALLVAGTGAGVSTTGGDERGTSYEVLAARAPTAPGAKLRDTGDRRVAGRREGGRRHEASGRAEKEAKPADDRDSAPVKSGGDGRAGSPAPAQSSPRADPPSTALADVPRTPSVDPPRVKDVTDAVSGAAPAVTDTVTGAADGVTDTVTGAAPGVAETVDQTVPELPAPVPDPAQVVPDVASTADRAVDDVTEAAGGLVGP